MDRDSLLALAGRVEALKKPCAFVDCAIFATMRPDRFDSKKEAHEYASDNAGNNRADWYYLRGIGMPLYTRSLDDAAKLVPEGWSWMLRGAGYAEVCHPRLRAKDAVVRAATPALALAAASLRAHAA